MKTRRPIIFSTVILLVLSLTPLVQGQLLELASGGKTTYPILLQKDATVAEVFAASELQRYLQQSTGAKFELLRQESEGTAVATQAIIVLFDAELADEEWSIRVVGRNLVISGGRPRGVLYGVHEFLEDFVGCLWLDMWTEVVPSRAELTIPDDLQIRRKPAFSRRYLYAHQHFPEEYRLFMARIKDNGGYTQDHAEYGFAPGRGGPHYGSAHSYLYYALDLPVEICWMNQQGKRIQVKSTTAGQICYTHPEARRQITEKLREYIREDRRKAAEIGKPYPVLYSLTANDCAVPCYCPQCQESAELLGVSGMVIDFSNAIAEAIEKDYPDIQLEMFAYKEAQTPPKGNIRTRKNVIVTIAVLDTEFRDIRDVLRPVNTVTNQAYFNLLKAWQQVTDGRIAIWDYWKLFYDPFPNPIGSVFSRPGYVQEYYKLGIRSLFVESEQDELCPQSFLDLRFWLAYKLLDNPDIDVSQYINNFLSGFYGEAAAVPMRQYLEYLERRTAEEKRPLGQAYVTTRVYLDAAFFVEASRLLNQAELLAKGNQRHLINISQERLILDIAYCNMMQRLPANLLGIQQQELMERIFCNLDIFGERAFSKQYWQSIRQATREHYSSLVERPPLPPEFQDQPVIDFAYPDFPKNFVIEDADALCGKVRVLPDYYLEGEKQPHRWAPSFGIYDPDAKQHVAMGFIPEAQVPTDEKYHLYYFGRRKIPETSQLTFWCHQSWEISCSITRLSAGRDPLEIDQLYDCYVSFKFQGPSYVKGSQLPDDFRFERVFFVKVNSEKVQPEMKRVQLR